ncbi:MAG: hypothetical protein GF331_18945 [Chitinivibrionales bacterium]|nr:hypothetical protein [Chitinivibrionales bacterium]
MLYKSTAASDMIPTRLLDSAVTDQFGRFAFANIDAGSYMLSFVSDKHQGEWLWVDARGDTTLSVMLLPLGATGSIGGTVTEACAPGALCVWTPPIPGCTVSVAIALVMYKSLGPVPQTEYMAVTDSDGRYTIGDIPIYSSTAAYIVRAHKPGYRDTSVSIALQYGSTERLDLSLMPTTLAAGSDRTAAAQRRSVSIDKSGHRLVLELARAQTIRVEAFDTRGRRLGGNAMVTRMAAGRQIFDLHSIGTGAAGTAVVRVRGDHFTEVLHMRPSVGLARR